MALKDQGYLMIDNRVSEGVSDELMRQSGLPAGSGRGLFEANTYTCNHCNSVVVMNSERIRERGYCRGCDSTICDGCAAIRAQTFQCVPMQRIIDETLSEVEKQTSTGSNILLLS